MASACPAICYVDFREQVGEVLDNFILMGSSPTCLTRSWAKTWSRRSLGIPRQFCCKCRECGVKLLRYCLSSGIVRPALELCLVFPSVCWIEESALESSDVLSFVGRKQVTGWIPRLSKLNNTSLLKVMRQFVFIRRIKEKKFTS